jgi:transposase-like protein
MKKTEKPMHNEDYGLTDEFRLRVLVHLKTHTYRETAATFNLSTSTVHKWRRAADDADVVV